MLSITAGEIGAKRERRSIPLSNYSGVGEILPTFQCAVSFPCVSCLLSSVGYLGGWLVQVLEGSETLPFLQGKPVRQKMSVINCREVIDFDEHYIVKTFFFFFFNHST